ncbi:MAG TPA: AIR synthase related protein [Actinomycetota bacterium]|nr:AIR synthase related protein [Actinomycetota bacterium]
MRDALGPTDWVRGPGDDAAALPQGDGHLLVAGEAVWPDLVAADPRAAGAAAVVANVNDIAAMGGRPLGLVDHVVAPAETARALLEGLAWAARLYDAPILGGHLTVREGEPHLSAAIVGRAERLLAAAHAVPEQTVLFACAPEGTLRSDFPFVVSLSARAALVAGDVEVLADLAESGAAVAAKDASMAGALGSLAMLLEPARCGASVDLDRMPLPARVPLVEYVHAFHSFGFWLLAPPEGAPRCVRAFEERGLAAAALGETDGTGRLRVRRAGHEVDLVDLGRAGITNLGPRART